MQERGGDHLSIPESTDLHRVPKFVTPKADVYSFGLLLCELWSGNKIDTSPQKSAQFSRSFLERLLQPRAAGSGLATASCPWRDLAQKCAAYEAEEVMHLLDLSHSLLLTHSPVSL